MKILSFIKKIFSKSKEEKVESDQHSESHRYESIRLDTTRYDSVRIDTTRSESIDTASRLDESLRNKSFISKADEDKNQITLERDSLQVGMVAGYISRSLVDIEDSIRRIEALAPTKDWITINIVPKIESLSLTLSQLKEIISKHELDEEKRFWILLEAIQTLRKIEPSVPENIRRNISSTAESLKKVALSPKMNEILQIVRKEKEISYTQLSQRLQISVDSLRGMISKMVKIVDEIERFEKDGKGWVRIKSPYNDTKPYENETLTQTVSDSIEDKRKNIEEW